MPTPQASMTPTTLLSMHRNRQPLQDENANASNNLPLPSKHDFSRKREGARANTSTTKEQTKGTKADGEGRYKNADHSKTEEEVKLAKEAKWKGTGNPVEYENENQDEPNINEKDTHCTQHNKAREEAPTLSLRDCYDSLRRLNDDIRKQYREQKGKLSATRDTPETLSLPVLRRSQVTVSSKRSPPDLRFQISDLLLPDETPTAFLYMSHFLPVASRVWASQFTRSCSWMSSGAHRKLEATERLQSLYCFTVDENSRVERRLRDGDRGSWQLFSVLMHPRPL
ncbi:hypothetical protein IFR05_006330 [Cadophora sp. M221]|nr:hypothetical protein IFR05_006330 [Cadophora sp. M221]